MGPRTHAEVEKKLARCTLIVNRTRLTDSHPELLCVESRESAR